MKLTKIFSAGIIVSLFLMSSVFAQNSSSADANVTASLKKGLSITNNTGDLNFGEIVLTGSADNPSIAPGNPSAGVKFEVIGHPGKTVAVTFSAVTLTNNAWVSTNGGNNDNLVFTPVVDETQGNSTYGGANNVTSGNSIALTNNGGLGYLYLWLGGSIAIKANQEQGDYVGTFTMNVAYN